MNMLHKASLKEEAKEYFASLTYISVHINIQYRSQFSQTLSCYSQVNTINS